jgi:uncharacterized protein YdiU (UPF0061 family)
MPSEIDAAGWRFDNSYTRLPPGLFTRSTPVPVRHPGVVYLNAPLAAALGLDPGALAEADGAAIFAGNAIPPGADPIAQAYAGHQFGHFTNLGDGRAILLGEQIAPDGSRHDIQLKGAGRTRYSRGGDGRAALGPMLREVLISEALHALGIPTTRSLAVASTGEAVLREEALPGAILVRVAASHIRVGTFQYAAAVADPTLLPALLAHAISRHDPGLAEADEPALAFLEAVIDRQAALIARWMQVGFIHGVMNTDNMAVSGETIDYGPCAFLDAYDPTTVFSSIDRQGRYAWANQPGIAHWNLARLAESLLPTLPGDAEAAVERISTVLATFPDRFARHALAGWRAKLGLRTEEDGDQALVTALLAAMEGIGADFTATFAALAAAAEAPAAATPFVAGPLADWRATWRARLDRQPQSLADATALMRRTNPLVIPRNHRVEEALAAAVAGEMAPFETLLDAITHPFDDTPATQPFRDGPPPGCGPYRTFCGT